MAIYTVFLKRDCETCQAVAPVLAELRARGHTLAVHVQDDPGFYAALDAQDDTALEHSFRAGVETVPTLVADGGGRVEGWHRAAWEALTGEAGLGAGLRAFQPGCGSKTREPFVHEALAAKYGPPVLASRGVTPVPATNMNP